MDRFKNFQELCRHAVEGRDFRIEMRSGKSNLAVMAPHGGAIEPGTDVLADAIAGTEHAFYAFKGKRIRNNTELHIASERFDEPRALAVARMAHTIITVHGCRGNGTEIYVGGLAADLAGDIIKALKKTGFAASGATRSSLAGVHRLNLCNRGRSRKGVQLELSSRLRRQLTATVTPWSAASHPFNRFVASIRHVLDRFPL